MTRSRCPRAGRLAAGVLGAVGALGARGPVAHADAPAPDPAAARAAEANLESTAARRGFTGTLAFGPSVTLGAGTGNGGAVSLRLGRVATPTTVITFEVSAAAQLRRLGTGASAESFANSLGSFVVGAQRWVGPSLWVRAGGGLGAFDCPKVCEGGADLDARVRRAGLAGVAGAGVDVVRFKGLVLAVEAAAFAQLNAAGLLATGSLGLGLSFE